MAVGHIDRLRLDPVEELPGTPEENVDDLVPRHRGDATARIDDNDQLSMRHPCQHQQPGRQAEKDQATYRHGLRK
ncbi:hypothetical protein SDC9_208486 [bioreactor metagenome]|uniref:Uncharacterized protein n=1 Tax=bioreactor metagenome TaxID=1076179 RepID=A0A645JKA0_9ZZZZ